MLYFGLKKFGQIDTKDKDNLVNDLQKQSKFIRKLGKETKANNYRSIKNFSEEEFNELNNELNDVNNSVITDNIKKNNIGEEGTAGKNTKISRLNDEIISELNQRLYYSIKEKYHLNHPDAIPKQKKKLLEYIILQKINKRKKFEEALSK